ncbi:uncharacterized mitochondrial protein AtMg00310-like [Vicia villosa]|uniref:uncharacterized mitochondrial protein AtMg00310-like n=1 Tax=Vicia villosa TaxID=3911 RepID=UPI00273AFF26|nr:uncharacterized mitochondrial protein AtMg00310-like [Vicia villosa]
MPATVAKEISSIQGNFLWGGGMEEKRRISWVSWKNVCLPVDKGGLGIKNISDFNLALLNKWRWRILRGEDVLWLNLLKAKYGDLNMKILCGGTFPSSSLSSFSSFSSPSFGSVWWRDLVSIGGRGFMGREILWSLFVGLELGMGFLLRFGKPHGWILVV